MSTPTSQRPGQSAPITILHAEDDPDVASLTATFLEQRDDRFSVETAPDAATGLDRLESTDVDCVVSDYEMPGTNGIEFLEEVRIHYPELPFILYTGKGSEEVASDAISAGVTDYLQKATGTSQYDVLANRITNAVEQRRSRRAVEETERKLSLIAEKTDDVLFMFDGDWSELLFVNAAYEEILGGSIEKLREEPRSFLEHVHPEDREKARRSMDRLARGEPDETEYRIVRPDGEQRWIRGDTKPVMDEAGAVTRVVGYVRDVTDKKRRARELERKERRYQAVFNDPNILVGLLATDGRVIEINETAMGYIDATRSDLMDEPFPDTPWFDHSERLQSEVTSWIARAADGEYVEFEADIRRADGEPVPIEGVFRPVTNDAGEVVSLLISDRDVSEQRAHERELERTNTVLSTLFEALPVGVLVEDESREVLAVNGRLLALFDVGAQPAGIVGRDCASFVNEICDQFVDPDTFLARTEDLVETHERVREEQFSLRDGGTIVRSHDRIDLPEGPGHLWVYRDVS